MGSLPNQSQPRLNSLVGASFSDHAIRSPDERTPRLGIEDRGYIEAGVAAGNHHGGRRLAEFGELEVTSLLRGLPVAQEAPMPFQQTLR